MFLLRQALTKRELQAGDELQCVGHDRVDFSLGGGEAIEFGKPRFKLLALIIQLLQAAIDEFAIVSRDVVRQVVDDAADPLVLILRPLAGGHELLVVRSQLFPDDGDDLLASALLQTRLVEAKNRIDDQRFEILLQNGIHLADLLALGDVTPARVGTGH